MKFFKTFLAALLAVFVGFGMIVMLWTMILVGMIAALAPGQTPAAVSDGSVLRLNVGIITDSPARTIFEQFDFATLTSARRTTLLSVIRTIDAAATDDRVEGIYLNVDEYASISLSSVEEIRAALVKFKESGKFIVAYQEAYGTASYYFASVADRIYLNPAGGFEWQGLSMQTMFYKGLVEKLGVQPVIVRHGTFKSAVEPFMLDKMSPANRLQTETFVGSIWNHIVETISEARAIPAADLQNMANTLAISLPQHAVDRGFVDGLRYEDEVMAEMAAMIENGWSRENAETAEPAPAPEAQAEPIAADKKHEVKLVSFDDYAVGQAFANVSTSKNKIAIVYAEGDIISGHDVDSSIGSASMVARLAKVRKDPDVKAVVFRVNSPGGSALASDVMWRELNLLKAEKPLIVSMGNYAASGGYYISCPADAILADRTTLTGSIGVFGLFFNVGDALSGKLGVTTDVVNTNTYSDLGSAFRAPSAAETAYLQNSVEDVYSTFISHVATGRNMTTAAVDSIGQGRIWSGVNAKEIGLVDGFGGIKDAITLAADRGGVADDFMVWEVSDAPEGLAAMFGGFSAQFRSSMLREEMGDAFVQYENLQKMLDQEGVQARMPYVLDIR